MKIASFNINGIKARLPALLDWLRDAAADVVVLQELKATDDQFPRLEIEEMGYNVETHGQKSFNGVAILSKLPIEDLRRGLPGDDGDEQARWIEATVAGIRVCGLYLPNGNPAPGPKYDYKLGWMDRLQARAGSLIETEGRPDVSSRRMEAADDAHPLAIRPLPAAAEGRRAGGHRLVADDGPRGSARRGPRRGRGHAPDPGRRPD
jgi:exodeoxyribonuclease III